MELQEVVDLASDLLGQPAILEDRDFHLVAFHSQNADVDALRQRSILERQSSLAVRAWFEAFGIATAEQPVSTPPDPLAGTAARLCIPARWNSVNYGYIWVLDPTNEMAAHPRVHDVLQLGQHAGALLAHRVAGRYDASYLLDSLLSSDSDRSARASEAILEEALISADDPIAVMTVLFTPAAALPINVWRLPRGTMASMNQGQATLLVRLTQADDLSPAENLASEIAQEHATRIGTLKRGSVVIGIGQGQSSILTARESQRQAIIAARVASALGSKSVALWPKLGVYRLLACEPQGTLKSAVLDARVLRLLDHAGAELVHSAMVFLEEAGSIQNVAERLAVHRQTVYYRVRKIEEVSGFDLSRGEDRLTLHLGLKLAPLVWPDR